jgi:hypothetical protein
LTAAEPFSTPDTKNTVLYLIGFAAMPVLIGRSRDFAASVAAARI